MNLKIGKNVFISAINGENCGEKEDLMDEIANALEFPDYFHENFDSLHECLTDLNWIDRNDIVLVINNYDMLLSEGKRENQDILKNVFQAVETHWSSSDSDRSFNIIEN